MIEPQPRSFEDFEVGLTAAEQRILFELDTGEGIDFGDDVPGADAGEDRRVRARFLRWVILGCAGSKYRLHEKGVQIAGALITGEGEGHDTHAALDLQGAEVAWDVLLIDCRFTRTPYLRNAQMQTLVLNGSHLPGFRADGLETRGDLFLRSADCDGEIRLLGAKIGGDLSCIGAKLRNAGGKALNADGARITGGFFWRNKASAEGLIDLTAAEIGVINDDPTCWPGKGDLALNRCRYGAFTGYGISARERLEWLALQDEARWGQEFWPQPYEHCAKVLREMGHADDAREILIEKERRLRDARRKREGKWMASAMGVRDWLFGWSVCYGQKPLRAAWYLLGLWFIGLSAFWLIYQAEAFKPNHAVVLRSAEWSNCGHKAPSHAYLGRPGEAQLSCFDRQPAAMGFPQFNAGVYSLDVVFPLVQLEQQVHWVPDEDQWQGWLGKALVYFQIIMGWLLSLLAVAGLSGIIKSD